MSFIRPSVNIVRNMYKTSGMIVCSIGDGLSDYVWRKTPPNPPTGILKIKNGKQIILQEIKIGSDYGMPLNPENYEYNTEVCNENYEGTHDKECYRWVEKTKIKCKCGGWISLPYNG
jgi:hypothetical protein